MQHYRVAQARGDLGVMVRGRWRGHSRFSVGSRGGGNSL
jgi:hypothetical protein